MATISLRQARKSYGTTEIIHGVDCEIADGEFLVIVGPSGCGKSTLLRMVAGLEEITAGEIAIDGKVVNDLAPPDRNISMVFQNYALYPHMTVYGNMAYGLKIRGLAKDEIERRVNKVADILALTPDMLKRKPSALSGGQRQRVAMGRAIVREPAVFLFDEPLSNLDAKLRVQMRLEIKQLQANLGITSIYVTHDQVEAMTLGHRLMVLSDGLVEQIGSPIELYEKPQTLFVAGFIGSPAMNIIPEATLAHAGVSLGEAGNRLVGIRPEDMATGDGGSKLSLKVRTVEQLGADTLVHGVLNGDGDDITLRLRGVHTISTGEDIPMDFPTSALHFFDADSGKRVES